MKTIYIGKREIRPHEQILADQEWLKSGWLYIPPQDLCDYKTAKAQSPEAGKEFLSRRQEQNRIEAENPKTTSIPKPALPRLALNDTMAFMQKIAQDGVLLELHQNKKLTACGWRSVVNKWYPKIMNNRSAIKRTLLQISSTHGDTDPLNLWELSEDVNVFRACDRLRELQDMHGSVKAVTLQSEEEIAYMIYAEFPEPADNECDSLEACK